MITGASAVRVKLYEALLINQTLEQNKLSWIFFFFFFLLHTLYLCSCVLLTVSCCDSHLYFPLDQFAGEQ